MKQQGLPKNHIFFVKEEGTDSRFTISAGFLKMEIFEELVQLNTE